MGFLAFWRLLVGFSGNMVGKWTNEPRSGVDEVVNHFWVLTALNDVFLASNGQENMSPS